MEIKKSLFLLKPLEILVIISGFFIGILVTQSHGKTGHLIHQFATGSMETWLFKQ